MFELSVACKYLIPRRRQLSVSIISLISILVIALVVWLIVVFFSVTDGLEKSWIQKLTALTAPVRITPTDAYYQSYYYLIDSISEASKYSFKTIREKKEGALSDPYNPEMDEEIPAYWATPDENQEGAVKDLVKLAYASLESIQNVPGLRAQDFELTSSHIQLNLWRHTSVFHRHNVYGGSSLSTLSYPAFLGNYENDNQQLGKTLLKLSNDDFSNLLSLLQMAPSESRELFEPDIVRKRLKEFFSSISIHKLQARSSGWNIPERLLPSQGEWEVLATLKERQIVRLFVPASIRELPALQRELEEQGLTLIQTHVSMKQGHWTLDLLNQDYRAPSKWMLTLAGGSSFSSELDQNSIDTAKKIDDLLFNVEIPLQGHLLKGQVAYKGLKIGEATNHPGIDSLLWLQSNGQTLYPLPKDPLVGEGVLLPKSFRDGGVLAGDRGSLSYFSPTASILQEQQIPIFVAGFYDPGIIPIGGKFILASREITSLIRSSHNQENKTAITNGINVHFNDIVQADALKAQLLDLFKKQGISRYWNIETYREYEFTKEIMHELQSQKNLFLLIAVVIILVACSNIISMLIILVNDKKMEIGILRSMGATSGSIAFIFGVAGGMIGMIGSAIGILAALFTLHHLNTLVALLSKLQGHEMFNANLYGQVLPHELSLEALSFVLLATGCLSLLAGIVPAIKACLLKPSTILRSGGG